MRALWVCAESHPCTKQHGVKDSIMTIGDRQYNFIHTYQVKMTLADADTDEEKQEVLVLDLMATPVRSPFSSVAA